jgi:membrane protein YqaA with SNARE-associated domain
VSGKSYPEFLHDRIFAPLGMQNTVVFVKDKNEVPNRAYGHTQKGDCFWEETDQSPTSATLGDGGVYSSLNDLAKWDDALANHTQLSAAEMQPALTPVNVPHATAPAADTEANAKVGSNELAAYGFGWFLDPYNGHDRMWHDGETEGFRSTIQRFTADHLTIIVLCNRIDLDPGALAEQVANLFFAQRQTQMQPVKMPRWLRRLVAAMGSGGLFVVTFLDSSVLSFPFVADALVIELSIENAARMPLYAGMAALGSLAGCIWLYLLAKKGGEAFFHRRAGKHAVKTRQWVDNNAFLSVFIPAILPPPFPFKIFVLAEGVFQVPLRTFVVALLLGRGLRYFAEGLFAVRYGTQSLLFLVTHGGAFAIAAIAVLLLLYIIGRLLFRHPSETR